MKLSKSESLFVIVVLLLLALLGYALYRDFTSRLVDEGTRIVGKLILKRNSAQRKYLNQVIWENLEKSIPLYNRDSIRTGNNSEALLVLNDGTEINVDENSMIVLNITENAVDIGFEGGALQVIGKKGSGDITITAGDKKVDIGESDVNLSRTEDAELDLAVNKGEVAVSSGTETVNVRENETAKTEAGALNVKRPPVVPISPDPGARIFLTDPDTMIPFRWDSAGKAATLHISPSRSFRKITDTIKTEKDGANVRVKSGSYYWRVGALDDAGQISYSAPRKIIILEKTPLQLTAPSDGSLFSFAAEEPYVNFAWQKNELASGYRLEVATDREFGNVIKNVDSMTTNLATRIGEGEYFWRITMKSPVESAVQSSEVRSFSVKKKKELRAPELVRPQESRSLGKGLFASEGVIFNWIPDPEAAQNELWISADSQFPEENRIVTESTNNFLIIKESLGTGKYFWKVRSKDIRGKFSQFSQANSFNIVDQIRLGLIAPDNRADLDETQTELDGISFSWENQATEGKYRLTLSRNLDMSSPITRTEIGFNRTTIKSPGSGDYYWQVEMLGENGKPVVKSDTRQFTILKKLNEPVPIFPESGSTVEMSKRDTLPFRWMAGDDTDYYKFSLFQNRDGIRTRIFEKETPATSITLTDLSLLDVGDFSWSIEAVRKTSGGDLNSREVISYFRISLEGYKSTEILSPEVQYIEVEDLMEKENRQNENKNGPPTEKNGPGNSDGAPIQDDKKEVKNRNK